ncbi:MAG: hypothetical protein ACI90V_000579 [Bacillariaceae sp.]|jgi:hypothetical protein
MEYENQGHPIQIPQNKAHKVKTKTSNLPTGG